VHVAHWRQFASGIAGGYSIPHVVPSTPSEEIPRPSRAKGRKSIGGAALRIALRGDLDRQQTVQQPPVSASTRKPSVTLAMTPGANSLKVQHTLHTPHPLSVDRHLVKRLKGPRPNESTSIAGEFDGMQYRHLGQPDLPVQEPMHRAWRVLTDTIPEITLGNEAATTSNGWRAGREAVFSPAADLAGGAHTALGLPSRIERLSSGSNGPLARRPLSDILGTLDTPGPDWKVLFAPACCLHPSTETRTTTLGVSRKTN
jgi:hypothetical protein